MDSNITAALIGVGGTVLATIIGTYKYRRRARNVEPVKVPVERVPLREKSATEVVEALKAIRETLKRQETVEHSYIGRWVRWSGTLSSVMRRRGFLKSPDTFSMHVFEPSRFGRWSGASIMIVLPITAAADVAPMAEGDHVEYEGVIDSVDGVSVYLKDGRIIEHRRVDPERPDAKK